MKITFEADSVKKEVYTLLVDGEPWAKLHQRIFGKKPRFESTTMEELCEEFVQKEWRSAKNYALKCLARKSYHSQELKKALIECLVNEVIICEVIEECKELGYINDADFIENLMRREKGKSSGPRKILWKIKHKGIEEEQISYTDEEQIEQLEKLIEKERAKRDLGCPKERQKVWGALMRKGYSSELIQQVINSLKIY